MTNTHWDDVAGTYQPGFKPTRAVVHKATEGTSFHDPDYAGCKARAAAGGHHFAAYHFLKAGNAAAQADFCFGVVGTSVPLMIDIESEGSSVPSIADVVAFTKRYRQRGGIVNVVYLPKWYWQGKWHSASLAPLAALGLVNINSDYSGGENNAGAYAAFGGMTVIGLQYTSTPHDINASHLTWAQVWAHFTAGAAAPKPPVSTPTPPKAPPAKTPTKTYYVKAGDTMSSIADDHDMTLAALKAANPHAGHPAGHYDVIWIKDALTVKA